LTGINTPASCEKIPAIEIKKIIWSHMTAPSNIPLKVPFKEKDEAKSHGARWNPDSKHWYIPIGVEQAPFEKWLNGAPATVVQPQVAQPQPASQTTGQARTASKLPSNADMDDINAMLRDAFETIKDQGSD
jgi:hypothetical protein